MPARSATYPSPTTSSLPKNLLSGAAKQEGTGGGERSDLDFPGFAGPPRAQQDLKARREHPSPDST